MNTIPDRLSWVKDEFDRIAACGVLGDPEGKNAYAYLRVSSQGQAEEGRSGFPRQLLHVHEKACQLHLCIRWELVFFDDHTGFEFRDRPALNNLRELVRSIVRPADDLVIENLDRLSREATWHQGYLLEEFERDRSVRIHFWKELPSKLERAVYGTISQDRMLTDLARMHEGNIHKAKTGRITARTPAYGYRLVNAEGAEENAKKDTHYGLYDPEANVMRQIYRWLVEDRATLVWISRELVKEAVKPPKRSRTWETSTLQMLVKNTVYKGEYYAHREMEVKHLDAKSGKTVTRRIERPRNEWILVPVPALVSPQVWEEAQRVVHENKTKSLRNSKRQYLLVGLLYCADCRKIKLTVGGRYHYRNTHEGRKQYESRYYRCGNRTRIKHIAAAMGYNCTMPQITARRLDTLVWDTVVNVLLDQKRLEEGMDRYFSAQKAETTKEELGFIQAQITDLDLEDERLYRAYVAGAFDAEEYAEKRHILKERKHNLQEEKGRLEKKLSQQSNQAAQKKQILASADELKQRAGAEVSFDVQRRILLAVVDKIVMNTREEWFELEGAIAGKFDFIPAGRGSLPRLG
jgi:site-specific DNA recombinase